MSLGKNNARIRSHMGDNCYLKYGTSPGAWVQIGKSNRWKIEYMIETTKAKMADNTTVTIENVRDAVLEIDLAQTHPEEMALIDLLRNSETKVQFWGDGGNIEGDLCEIYIPELIIGGGAQLETPSGENMKIPLKLGIQPQSAVVSGNGAALPTVSNQGDAVNFTGNNEYFAYFVSAAA